MFICYWDLSGGARPPRFWQNRKRRITTCPLRFSDLAPSLLNCFRYLKMYVFRPFFEKNYQQMDRTRESGLNKNFCLKKKVFQGLIRLFVKFKVNSSMKVKRRRYFFLEIKPDWFCNFQIRRRKTSPNTAVAVLTPVGTNM